METRASYLIVGLFVIAGMIGLVFAAMWITGTRTDEAVALYDIYFDGNVSGLKPGNVVQYRGIPVGGVVDMRIDPDNVERVLVTIEVDADTPIREDTEATLALQGITGLSYIQLTGGTQAAAELKAATGQRRPVIKSRPSELAAIFEAAPELLNRAIGVIAQLEKLLGPENQGH
ncbi:MAG: MlaD family protein, partial [Alphaproteobacteria bacterium]|nr:MlaD family protein [Alphaproteobacteria bacterium]